LTFSSSLISRSRVGDESRMDMMIAPKRKF
jgi:hypothetical protein